MSLSDLTRESVRAAIEEFDRLGRDAFLAKYGFGEAREYLAEHDGRRYDSKAIAGAAHGYAKPEDGPLRHSAFSGGDATVGRLASCSGWTRPGAQPRPPTSFTARWCE